MDEYSDDTGAKLSNFNEGGNWPARQGKAGVALRVVRWRDELRPIVGAARQERLSQQ